MLMRQSAIYGLGSLAHTLIGVGMIAFYSRVLSAEDYGLYAFAMASVQLAYGLTINWLCTTLIRQYDGAPDKTAFLGAVLGFYLIAAGITSAVALGLVMRAETDNERLLIVTSLATFLAFAWMELQFRLYQAQLEALKLTRDRLLRSALGALIGGALAWAGWGPLSILIGTMVGAIVPGLAQIFRVWLRVPVGGTREMRQRIWTFGAPLVLSFALFEAAQFTMRGLVVWIEGVAVLGIYAMALEMAMRLSTALMMPINAASGPLAVRRLESDGVAAARESLRQTFILMVALGLPSMAGIILVTPDLATVMVGETFRPGVIETLPWLIAGAFVLAFQNFYLDQALHLGLKSSRLLYRSMVALSLHLALGYVLIGAYGMIGAAYSYLTIAIIGAGLTWAMGRNAFPLAFPGGQFLRVCAATGAMVAAVISLPGAPGLVMLLAKALVGVLVYGAAILVLDVSGTRRQVSRLVVLARARIRRAA